MRYDGIKVGIYTLGCKVNQYESEAIAEGFESFGCSVVSANDPCDVYVINTCTVTAESDRKARQFIRRARSHNTDAVILVTGCFSQVAPEEIAKIEGVDYISGNTEKLAVVRAAFDLLNEKRLVTPRIEVGDICSAPFEKMSIKKFDRTRAYLKIEDGCESRCTYCIIPSARGRIRSKAPEDVIREVEYLTCFGCREIVLTGIETASYGKDLGNTNLADLLTAVDKIGGIGRVRLGSLDPSLITPKFVDKIKTLKSLAPHFHLSLQSGSSRILALMKRKYNAETAMRAIELLREAIPSVQFTTDVIVGFPGETDEDFEQTLNFARRARFLQIHVFPYSKRKGTLAASMPNQLPKEIKHERLVALSSLEASTRLEMLGDIIEKEPTQEVLFESFENGRVTGHTANFIEVVANSDIPLHSEIRKVRLTATDGKVCFAEITD